MRSGAIPAPNEKVGRNGSRLSIAYRAPAGHEIPIAIENAPRRADPGLPAYVISHPAPIETPKAECPPRSGFVQWVVSGRPTGASRNPAPHSAFPIHPSSLLRICPSLPGSNACGNPDQGMLTRVDPIMRQMLGGYRDVDTPPWALERWADLHAVMHAVVPWTVEAMS
jgi:hypothetical protein